MLENELEIQKPKTTELEEKTAILDAQLVWIQLHVRNLEREESSPALDFLSTFSPAGEEDIKEEKPPASQVKAEFPHP